MKAPRNEELDFYPAALEIQEKPPLPISRYILWLIMLFFVLAVIWASVGKVDIVAVAHGKIIPSGKIKVIQPLESGVVRRIYVSEGEQVLSGAPLIELDTTLSGADHDSIKEQLLDAELNRAALLTNIDALRQVTEVNATDSPHADHFRHLTTARPEQRRIHRQRARHRLDEYRANLAALIDEKRQRQAERNAIAQRIQQLDATLPLITERAASMQELASKNMLPRVQWLEIEQQRIEQYEERDVQTSHLESLNAAISVIQQRRSGLKAKFESELLTELAEVENRIAALEQERRKAEKRLTLQKLLAPVSGKVHRLAVHTIGGVVTPAQELMQIVPDAAAIEVEAWLPNRDIGFVQEGQAAEIKVETFPFTRYGTIAAEIENISNDAVADEKQGLVYAMRVRLQQLAMHINDREINLSPGMAVTVEVNLGQRRLIEYLLSPLLRYKDESVRER